MSATSPLPILLIAVVALISVFLLDRRFKVTLADERVTGIDGLRGYLALAVFMHHSLIWYFFLRQGRWEVPPSVLYAELGHSSVALFFMITGFLFTSRILGGADKPIDWNRLYTSRLLRILPLYILHHLIALLIIATIRLAHLPTLFGAIDTDRKVLITAAVSWTLDFEWMFYLLLPLMALLRGLRPPLVLALLSALVLMDQWHLIFTELMLPFLGGLFAALLAYSGIARNFSRTRRASLLVAASLALAFSVGTSHGVLPWLSLLTMGFTLIACGNDLSGLLSCRPSRVLGEITYSVYLLHGVVLFLAFRVVLGIPFAAGLDGSMHWLTVAAATPLLIALSFASWRYIEMPCMRRVDRWSLRLRFSLTPRSTSSANSPSV